MTFLELIRELGYEIIDIGEALQTADRDDVPVLVNTLFSVCRHLEKTCEQFETKHRAVMGDDAFLN